LLATQNLKLYAITVTRSLEMHSEMQPHWILFEANSIPGWLVCVISKFAMDVANRVRTGVSCKQLLQSPDSGNSSLVAEFSAMAKARAHKAPKRGFGLSMDKPLPKVKSQLKGARTNDRPNSL
jgi:hypothetical protein